MTAWEVIEGDCVETMAAMPASSVDAICTDPPYELGFMGRAWDRSGVAYRVETWAQALRVLKPGGHLLAFGGTRTYHRLACAIEDAGFEIRDTIAWMYGSGFPKSLDVSKAIDTAAGAEREVVGTRADGVGNTAASIHKAEGFAASREPVFDVTAPATPDAERWQGWGTALKPAHEPIVVARKPLAGTVAANVLAHGTGALNVDGCRIEAPDGVPQFEHKGQDAANCYGNGLHGSRFTGEIDRTTGRWPANVVLDPEAAAVLDEQTGTLTSGKVEPHHADNGKAACTLGEFAGAPGRESYGDSGGASRFFYCAKASSAERNAGLDGFEAQTIKLPGKATGFNPQTGELTDGYTGERRNTHPTVKPVALMRWLVRLITPPGGLVLDPFNGSGTTGCAAMLEGFRYVGLEREAEYAAIARARIAWWAEHPDGMQLVARLEHEAERKARADSGQLGLFEAQSAPMVGNGRNGEASADRRYTDRGGSNFAMKPGRRRD